MKAITHADFAENTDWAKFRSSIDKPGANAKDVWLGQRNLAIARL